MYSSSSGRFTLIFLLGSTGRVSGPGVVYSFIERVMLDRLRPADVLVVVITN